MRRASGVRALEGRVVSDLRADGRSDAADTVLRDWESFVSF